MYSINELQMRWTLWLNLRAIPNEYRSHHHSLLMAEYAVKIYDLVDALHLSQDDWDTMDFGYLPLESCPPSPLVERGRG